MKKLSFEERNRRQQQLKEQLHNGELSIGQAVKKMRNSNGITQKDFAKAIGMTITALSELENDKSNPTLKTLDKIGKCFNLKISFLPK